MSFGTQRNSTRRKKPICRSTTVHLGKDDGVDWSCMTPWRWTPAADGCLHIKIVPLARSMRLAWSQVIQPDFKYSKMRQDPMVPANQTCNIEAPTVSLLP